MSARRRVVITVVAVVAVLVLGIAAVVVLRPTGPAEPDRSGLVILSGLDESIGSQRQRLVDDWNALNPTRQATLVELPASADVQRSEMLARAQAGGGGVDVYNLDATWTAEFDPYLADLPDDAAPADEFLEGPLRSSRYGGALKAVPFNTDVGLLYYNEQLLELVRPGGRPPTSWEQIEQDVDQLRRLAPELSGFVGQFAGYEGLTVNALEAVRGEGAAVVDTDGGAHEGRVTLDDAQQRDRVEAALSRLGRIAAGPGGGVPPLDEADATRVFQAGEALYMRNWPVANRTLAEPAEPGRSAVGFGVVPLPGSAGLLGGQNLAVSSGSDRYDDALDLIRFLTSEESQRTLMVDGGFLATRGRPYEDAAEPVVPIEGGSIEQVIQGAGVRPELVHYGRFSSAFRTVVDQVLRGDALSEEDDELLERAVDGRTAAPVR